MLPDATISGSLAGLLMAFRSCFTAPTFDTFSAMTVGLIARTRRRTVCGMLLGVGLERRWHHARAHRFFAVARWCTDELGLTMLDLIVDRLLPARLRAHRRHRRHSVQTFGPQGVRGVLAPRRRRERPQADWFR
jgi:DDE superfamily endonuclease